MHMKRRWLDQVPPKANFASVDEFLDELQSGGRYVFSREQLKNSVQMSESGLYKAIRRLKQAKRLVIPHREVYIIVPLEYRSIGSLPPPSFVDAFMKTLHREYYVGLLSAAALYGAAHQQPQEFQVMTKPSLRAVRAGRGRIRFFVKKELEHTPKQQIKTQTGRMWVSTPEATALDLVRYAPQIGGLSHVALVLSELQECLQEKTLIQVVSQSHNLPMVQRLGYLLQKVGNHTLSNAIAAYIKTQHPKPVKLSILHPQKTTSPLPPFQLLINAEVDVEEVV